MDSNSVLVLVITLLALGLIVALLAFRKRIRGSIVGPMKTRPNIDAYNFKPPPCRPLEDVKSYHVGNFRKARIGRNVFVRRAEGQPDINVTGNRAEVNSCLVERTSVVRAVRGKYARLPISSEEFAAQKQGEIKLEDRG